MPKTFYKLDYNRSRTRNPQLVAMEFHNAPIGVKARRQIILAINMTEGLQRYSEFAGYEWTVLVEAGYEPQPVMFTFRVNLRVIEMYGGFVETLEINK